MFVLSKDETCEKKKNWKDKYVLNRDFTESCCYRLLSRAVLKSGGTSRGSQIDRYLSLSKRDILILDGREMAKLPRKYLIFLISFFFFLRRYNLASREKCKESN